MRQRKGSGGVSENECECVERIGWVSGYTRNDEYQTTIHTHTHTHTHTPILLDVVNVEVPDFKARDAVEWNFEIEEYR